MEEYDKAIRHFGRALELSSQLQDKGMEGNTLVNLGALYLRQGRFAEAEPSLLRAEKVLNESAELYELKDCYLNLVQLYRRTNRNHRALSYFEKYDAVKDSIFTQENSINALRYEMNFEYAKKAAADSARNLVAHELQDAEIATVMM